MPRCIYAPEGCQHGTHTNGTAYTRGTYSRVHTQTHTNTNKRTARPDKVRCGLTPWRRPPHQRRAPRPHPQRAASLSRSPTPKLCAPPPRGAVTAARATSTSSSSLHSRTTAAWGCFYTDNSTRKGGTVQRGLPRESFEQNEVDGYRTGRADTPSAVSYTHLTLPTNREV